MQRLTLISIAPLFICSLLASCQPAPPAGGSSSASPSSQPSQADHPHYTYVLVHGAWAGGWEWKRVGSLLEADGHTVYRPTLTGLGDRVHLSNPDIDLNTHITDIVNAILFENLHDIVLMGHSYGGMVITGVADRVPDRIKALVYVDAILPEDGESANQAMARPPRPTTNNTVWPGQWPPRAGQLPPYDVPHPANTFSQPIELKNPAATARIPVTYILTVDPGKKPEEDRFYKFYQRARSRGWTTWIMEGDHVVNITRPAELSKLLEQAPAAAKPKQGGQAR